MKTLLYIGPKNLVLAQRDVPMPGKDEVLLQVKACGICGSDIHGYLGITGRRVEGYAMGHEFSAVVAGLGENVSGHEIGERVIVQPIDHCGHCRYCLEGNTNLCYERRLMGVLDVQGAMAEYICVPAKLLIPMAENCSFETGAMAEPFAVAYAGVDKIADYTGKTVLIIGAGMIGLCLLEMLKLRHPGKIIMSDVSASRLERALSMGADAVINPVEEDYIKKIEMLTGGNMCDITIEAVGIESTVNQSVRALRKNGVSVWLGVSQHDMTIDMHDIVTYQRTIIGSMNYSHSDFQKTVALLNEGKLSIEKLLSKTVSLDEAAEMLEEIHNHPDAYLKVIINKF